MLVVVLFALVAIYLFILDQRIKSIHESHKLLLTNQVNLADALVEYSDMVGHITEILEELSDSEDLEDLLEELIADHEQRLLESQFIDNDLKED